MRISFLELPLFERYRESYLDDSGLSRLQALLIANPEIGEVIQGTGGLRKVRFGDLRRGKGKRGGLRVIYLWWPERNQIWLVTLFDKNEAADLTPAQRQTLKALIKTELRVRSKQ